MFLVIALAQMCIPDNERIDCHPDGGASQERCLSRGCTWCPAAEDGNNIPWCFVPKNYGYKIVGEPVVGDDGFRY